jgi:hypothetical protein
MFSASRVTVQKALDRLADEGFVYAKGRRGTWVAEHPPHLWHYGLVFPNRPSDGGWVRFWTALANEAERIGQQAAPRRMSSFFGVTSANGNTEYRKLLDAAQAHRFAGLIFAAPPPAGMLAQLAAAEPRQPSRDRQGAVTPLAHARGSGGVAASGMPVVAIMSGTGKLDFPIVDLDIYAFLDRALDYLKACGKRHIALMTVPFHGSAYYERFRAALAARGLDTRPYWTQAVSPTSPICAKSSAHLLLNPDQRVRPDGLILSDDNLVEYATSGLIAAGARVPDELAVVAHCNFPWPTPSVIPVKRLGFDARQVLQLCVQRIDQQRRGGGAGITARDVPAVTDVLPVFEEELPYRAELLRAGG